MIIATCHSCGLPVVEVRGQYAILDALHVRGADAPLEAVGRWHPWCLSRSEVADPWFQARGRNYRHVRRFELLLELPSWIVLADPRDKKPFALGRNGVILPLVIDGAPRRVQDGLVFSDEVAPFNLELAPSANNERTITDIQAALAGGDTYPLPALFAALGIAEKVEHPEALAGSVLHALPSGTRHWGRYAVAAGLTYGFFVAEELRPFIASPSGRGGAAP